MTALQRSSLQSRTNLALLSINMEDQKQSKMPKTKLEECCDCIMDIFHKYSIKMGHPDTLNKGEFARFLKEQLPSYIQDTKKPEEVNRLFNKLDKNKDGKLNFEEFMTYMGEFMVLCHEHFHHKH